MSSATTEPASPPANSITALPADPFERIRAGSELPGPPPSILPFVQAYISIGLFGPARELVLNSNSSDRAECESLLKRFAAKPSGRVPWGSLLEVFRPALARLLDRHPNLEPCRAQLESLPDATEVFRSANRGLHLSYKGSFGLDRWVGCLLDSEALVSQIKLAHKPGEQFCPNYLLCGDRFGAMLRRTHSDTSRMFLSFSPRLFIVEPEPFHLAASLCLVSTLNILVDERMHILVGENAIAELSELLRSNVEFNPPTYLICLPPYDGDAQRPLADHLREMFDERSSAALSVAHANTLHYSQVSRSDWAARFQNSRSVPLKILGITSRFTTVLQYAMRDMKTAFEKAGHQFATLIEPNNHDLLQPLSFARAVADHKPDLIFCIDHLRREYADVLPANVPYVGWVQDMLPNLTCGEAGRSIGPLDFYLCASKTDLALSYEYPEDQGLNVTTVTDDALFSAESLPPEELAPYRCDVSFVSNQSETPAGFHQRICASFQDGSQARMLCDELFRILHHELMEHEPPGYPRRAQDLLLEAQDRCGKMEIPPQFADAISRQYVQPLGELMFRQKALAWVAGYCNERGLQFRLYGQGWEAHPQFARHASGVAANGRTLRAIAQASKINLQINGYGCIHPRLLDGLASGGFFLIRQTGLDLIGEDLGDLLTVQTDLPASEFYKVNDAPTLRCAFAAERKIAGNRRAFEDVELDRRRLKVLRELAMTRRVGNRVFREYDDVSFSTSSQFAERADHFLRNEEARFSLVRTMRDTVTRHFTNASLISELLGFVEERLAHPVTRPRSEALRR